MTITLTENEARVIGVLLEKSVTTPEQYPLSLNALTNGCNQKSNRLPVTQYSEDDIIQTLDSLKAKRLIQLESGFGSRVTKYAHRFCNTEFGDLKLSEFQQAIITELLLRGPQTPGELRGRCQRLAKFSDVGDVESTINSLIAYQPNPLICALPKEAGKREVRYRHLFSHPLTADETPSRAPDAAETIAELRESLSHVKSLVTDLEAKINALENAQTQA